MNKEKTNKIIISCSMLSISEMEGDSSRRIAKFLICPLDEGNGNNKGIKESDLSEVELNTIVGQPLVTKVIYDSSTKAYDFSGHLMKAKYELVNGKIIKYNDFQSTNPIGYHTEVAIEEIEIDGIVKKCLVGTCVLWTRYRNAMSVIDRLGNSLRTSWELSYTGSYTEDGVEWLTGILFLGNCLLGTNITPAYRNAGLLEVAEEDLDINVEDDLSIAFIQDMNEELSSQSDENSVEDIENTLIGGNHRMEKEKNENAALTSDDLGSRVRKAIYSMESNGTYYFNVLVYPFELVAYAKRKGKDTKEEDWTKFVFAVNSDETISITSSEEVKMIFIPKAEQETIVAELEEKIKLAEEKNTDIIAEKDGEIIKLGETIASLQTSLAEKETEIAELQPYKEAVAEQKKKEEEEQIKQKQTELASILVDSKYFTKAEVEKSEEIQVAISELDENKIHSILAKKVISVATEISSKNANSTTKKEAISELSTDIGANEQCDYTKTGNAIADWLLKSNKNKY